MNKPLGRSFWFYFATLFISAFNDNVFKNALVVLVAFRGARVFGLDSGSVVALAGGVFMLPYFLFSPLAGQIADRYDKSRVIRATKAWEMLVMALAAVGFYWPSFEFLLVVLFMAGVQAAFFGPVKYGVIPELADDTQLTRANALVEAGTFLAILLGTLLGGGLAAVDDAGTLGASLVAIAGLGYVVSRGVHVRPSPVSNEPLNFNPAPGLVELMRLLGRSREVAYAVVAISWFWFIGAATLSILPAFGRETLNVDASVVTFFLCLFTVGIGVGSLVGERASRGRLKRNLVPLGALGTSAFALELVIAARGYERPTTPASLGQFLYLPHAPSLALAFALMAVAGGVFILPLYTLLQERSRPEVRARIIAANNVVNAIFMIVASLGLVAARALGFDYPSVFLSLGVLNGLVVGLVLWRAPALAGR